MTAATFYLGSTLTLQILTRRRALTYAGAQEPYDPAVPTVIVRKPDGLDYLFTYPASINFVQPTGRTVGQYLLTLLLDQTAWWQWELFDPHPTRPGRAFGGFYVATAPFA